MAYPYLSAMPIRRLSSVAAAALLFCTLGLGASHAQGTVADFSLQTANNSTVTLKSYAGKKAVVVVFLNSACAYSRLYQERLASLSNMFSGRGVQFLFVYVPINLDAPGGVAPGLAYLPTLTDASQQVSSLLGVSKTTEAVVLQPGGDGFAVRYRGAIDDNPQVASGVQQPYLREVLENLVAGRPAGVADRRAAGCLIKR